MNRKQYNSDPRYAKVLEKMDLLGIMDITTTRQHKNGTIVWKLPIKNNWKNGKLIEVASFSTGYVRNQNSGYSNYQLNKRCQGEPEYFNTGKNDSIGRPLYRKFTTRSCVLIPIEIDRLEYLISYCLKNYFIKRANEVADGKLIPKWKLEHAVSSSSNDFNGHRDRINDLEEKLDAMTEARDYYLNKHHSLENKLEVEETYSKNLEIKLAEAKVREDVSVIVNGHRYKVL